MTRTFPLLLLFVVSSAASVESALSEPPSFIRCNVEVGEARAPQDCGTTVTTEYCGCLTQCGATINFTTGITEAGCVTIADPGCGGQLTMTRYYKQPAPQSTPPPDCTTVKTNIYCGCKTQCGSVISFTTGITEFGCTTYADPRCAGGQFIMTPYYRNESLPPPTSTAITSYCKCPTRTGEHVVTSDCADVQPGEGECREATCLVLDSDGAVGVRGCVGSGAIIE